MYFVPDRNDTGVPGGEVLRYDTGAVAQFTTLAIAARSGSSRSVIQTVAEPAAVTQVSAGRVFAEVDGPVNTRITLANLADAFAEVSFYFTDSGGMLRRFGKPDRSASRSDRGARGWGAVSRWPILHGHPHIRIVAADCCGGDAEVRQRTW